LSRKRTSNLRVNEYTPLIDKWSGNTSHGQSLRIQRERGPPQKKDPHYCMSDLP